MNVFNQGLVILEKLNNAGFEAYIVGGAVRDYLLKKEITDIDITTNARVEDICKIFNITDYKALDYAGVTIEYNDLKCEITSYRKDVSYHDHRHPVVEYVDNISEDLKRRDFTINALALDRFGNIIDLFNGIDDINSKIIKCIGEPNVRFGEDALRVLRALYFSSKLDFDLDDLIIRDIVNTDFISYLPKEYIKDMFEKIISFNSYKGLKYIVKYKLFKSFPFYQVLANECFKYGIGKEYCYSLFYSLHGFLPENERLEKKDIKKAKDISKLVRNHFDEKSLYESKGCLLKEAAYLYSKIYYDLGDVVDKYNRLPIHNIKDIDFDFSKFKNRSIIQKEIVDEILNHGLNNNYDDILNYLVLRGFYA